MITQKDIVIKNGVAVSTNGMETRNFCTISLGIFHDNKMMYLSYASLPYFMENEEEKKIGKKFIDFLHSKLKEISYGDKYDDNLECFVFYIEREKNEDKAIELYDNIVENFNTSVL